MLSKLDKQPLDAVLAGLIMIIGFVASHSDIEVEGIDWVEPVLVWVAICMPTGSGKSTLCKFLVRRARTQCAGNDGHFWLSDDQSFEKPRKIAGTNCRCSWHRLMYAEDAA